mmetsp:Transcript_133929/g.267281  ORF Transcript_133929/g.267281 Transcript_133929/m.267281 type:complete len:334 (-) Transcript_133929:141-1142(-)
MHQLVLGLREAFAVPRWRKDLPQLAQGAWTHLAHILLAPHNLRRKQWQGTDICFFHNLVAGPSLGGSMCSQGRYGHSISNTRCVYYVSNTGDTELTLQNFKFRKCILEHMVVVVHAAGHILQDVIVQPFRVVLDEDKHHVRVVGFHLVYLRRKLRVVHVARTILVEDVKDGPQVIKGYVHCLHAIIELPVLKKTLLQLIKREGASLILVQLLAEVKYLVFGLLELCLLHFHNLAFSYHPSLLSRLDYCCQDEIYDCHPHGCQDNQKVKICQRFPLNDGDRNLAPTITSEESLRESQKRALHRAECTGAPFTAVVRALRSYCSIYWVDYLHSHY